MYAHPLLVWFACMSAVPGPAGATLAGRPGEAQKLDREMGGAAPGEPGWVPGRGGNGMMVLGVESRGDGDGRGARTAPEQGPCVGRAPRLGRGGGLAVAPLGAWGLEDGGSGGAGRSWGAGGCYLPGPRHSHLAGALSHRPFQRGRPGGSWKWGCGGRRRASGRARVSAHSGHPSEALPPPAMQELEKCEANHYIILFRDAGCQFRALYCYYPDSEEICKLTGTGPRSISKKMIDKLYKYSSDRKQFNLIPAKTMSVSVDALTIHNHLWQPKRPAAPKKTQARK